MKELTITGIEEGTVIDHIPAGKTFKLVEILKLETLDNSITVGINLSSSTMKKKGIIKIGGKILSSSEMDKIALAAPDATINMIKNYEVKKKEKAALPDIIENIVKCTNPMCISNHEEIKRKFYVLKKNPLKTRCHYCERNMNRDEIMLV